MSYRLITILAKAEAGQAKPERVLVRVPNINIHLGNKKAIDIQQLFKICWRKRSPTHPHPADSIKLCLNHMNKGNFTK